jgi:SsrA-binding protein
METIFNKRARFDYELLESFEAGIRLAGHEVKAVKAGQINLTGSFVVLHAGHKPTLNLINANIHLYPGAGKIAYDPTRSRALLLHRREINYLIGKLQQKGLTLVPTRVYTKNNLVKLEFALARGKKKFDKRETIKKREVDRSIRRIMKG